MFKMATPSRNREGSCPGRLNLVTSKDREVFLKAIHKDFIDKVDPLQSGFMDELYACSVLTETDTESLQGNNVNTRRDTARKLLIILTEIPFNVFSSRVVPLLCSMFPHIIPQNFWANDDDLIASDDQQNGTHCWRCAIIKRIRPKTLADLLYAANSLELPKYKKIISHGYNDEVMWAQIFQAFTGKPPDVSKHLSDEITSILQRYSFHCPENLHDIMSQGFPCECRKVDHVKPSSFEKVAGWLQMDTTNSSVWQKSENLPTNLTLPDMSSESESRNTSTVYPNSSEHSERDTETESTSLASNTTLHAELKASVERGFETFRVSPLLINLPVKYVLTDKHKLKVAEWLNKDHISRNDCPNNGNLSDTLRDIFSETESRHTSTFVPDSKEDSDGKSEALSSYSDLSNCTAYYIRSYAESEASMESGFETFHVSTSKNDLSAKIVPEDENKLKVAEWLKEHYFCPGFQ